MDSDSEEARCGDTQYRNPNGIENLKRLNVLIEKFNEEDV